MEKKERRKHVFRHRPYLDAIADRIVQTIPGRDIVFNTLLGVYETAFAEGYQTSLDDKKWFKSKREEHRQRSFDMIRGHFEELIHPSTNEQQK
jgi:hypothetical protein